MSKPAIKVKSEIICEQCLAIVPYPFQHPCDPTAREDNEAELLARQGGGEAVLV